MNNTGRQPHTTIDSQDKGDDVLLRFRYQITCAAIASLKMFDDKFKIKEIYCEQFEDYLIKDNGLFIGTQVKTRNLDDPPFSLNDPQVMKMLHRFTSLDLCFPNHFSRFSIVSNHGFSKKKSTSIERMIDLAKKDDIAELCKKNTTTNKVIKELTKKLKCTEREVISCIGKIKIISSFASLDDIKQKLVYALREINFISRINPTLSDLERIADSLVMKFFEMSSLGNISENLSELFVTKRQSDISKISGKRINKAELKNIIIKNLEDPVTLAVRVPESISNIRATWFGVRGLNILGCRN